MSATALEDVVTPLAPLPARAKATRARHRRVSLGDQIVQACILERLVQTVESLVRSETHEQQAEQLADSVARQVTQNLRSTNRLEQHS